MAKRKRLTPAQPLSAVDPTATAPETKSAALRPAPIAQVASEAATTHALQELTQLVSAARAEGRLIQPLPLSMIEAGHLIRDRLMEDADEDMQALITSLRARGQQTPIDVVALEDGRFGLISGLRRLTALTRIGAETVLARIIAPDTASAAYVAMVEENEIRAGLSLYERARIVAKAVEAGVFPDTRDALLTLYANTARAKRSKIKAVLPVVEALDGVLRFPTALSERACLDLARALEGDPGLAEALRTRLTQAAPDTAQAEAAVLTGPVAPKPAPAPAPDPGSMPQEAPQIAQDRAAPAKNSDEMPNIFGKSQAMQIDKSQETGEVSSAPHKPLDAFEPFPGIYIQSQTNPQGHTRLIFSGPNVTDGLRQKITTLLRLDRLEQEKGGNKGG